MIIDERSIDIEFASFHWFKLNNIYNHSHLHKSNYQFDEYIHSSNMISNSYVLNDIELHIRRKLLVFFIGESGAGKSSLFNAMLGEMSKINGYVGIRGSISYYPQKTWLFNGTIRENILLNVSGFLIYY